MLERVLKTISRYNMLAPGTRVAVAVSGGPDSVCLLHVLRELAPTLGAAIAGVAHFNHKLRGAASDADEHFVADLAASHELPFFRAEADLRETKDNLEQAGRRERWKFFAELRQSCADVIALGHTHDDQAETVLFRLLRGSGLAGLAGIKPVIEGAIIRPLIEVDRADVEQFLRDRGIAWREDASNRDPRFSRNRIRHDLLPQLRKQWNPRISESLANMADLARDEEEYWAQEIDAISSRELLQRDGGIELRVGTLEKLPKAVSRRLVRRAIELAKGDLRRIEYDHVEQVLNLQNRLRIPGLNVTRSFDWLRFESPSPKLFVAPIQVTIPGVYPAPDGKTRIWLGREPVSQACATLKVKVSGRNASPLELRGWKPGDHYCPVGQSRDQKIKEMFQRARVPSWRRALWPILTSGDNILWAREFGVAREVAPEPGSGSRELLRIWETDVADTGSVH